MSEAKFTKGPWVAHFDVPAAVYPGHIVKVGKYPHRPICNIPKGGGTKGEGEQIANARLIAAAPDMFEALKAARELLSQDREGYLKDNTVGCTGDRSDLDPDAVDVVAVYDETIAEIDLALALATKGVPAEPPSAEGKP